MSKVKNMIIGYLIRSIKDAKEIDRLMNEMRYYSMQVISPFIEREKYSIIPISVIGKYLECLSSEQIEKACGERIGMELVNKGLVRFSRGQNNDGTKEIKATILVCREGDGHDAR
jgi:hypothetical protein